MAPFLFYFLFLWKQGQDEVKVNETSQLLALDTKFRGYQKIQSLR